MTTVELAYNAENKEFLAHDACQKMGYQTVLWRNYTT